jgi:2-oxo-4-hydroxy-4-carboxy-5-ureidoimidazoline decarboxylase
MARLRVWGDLSENGYREARLLYLNSSTPSTLSTLFKQVCHSDKWVKEMVKSAPFKNQNDLLKKGARAWSKCKEKDWIEALDGHPRIGQKAKGSSLSARWSKGEQSAAKSPDERILEQLAEAQQNYFEKFGFIFLICASGRGSKEILEAVKERLPHSAAEEMQIVAEEQAKIIHLRLEKLLN